MAQIFTPLVIFFLSLGATAEEPPVVRLPQAERLVAIGDLHGDLAATRDALRLAGAIDENDRWIGGKLVVVQTGDLLDRGDDEPEILQLLEKVASAATASGGRLVVLNGNHELMNAAGDLRYVTADGLADYGGPVGRRTAFAPGSLEARRLAAHAIYAIIGDTLFVHGGLLPAQAPLLETLDRETRAWLRGERPAPPRALIDTDGPLWTRAYSGPEEVGVCAAVRQTLEALKLKRIVVGHTVQETGINSICDGQIWRIDVGLARRYGGPLQLLELNRGRIHIRRATKSGRAAPR